MRQLKIDKLVVYKSSMTGGDYMYELTDLGRDRAPAHSASTDLLRNSPSPAVSVHSKCEEDSRSPR